MQMLDYVESCQSTDTVFTLSYVAFIEGFCGHVVAVCVYFAKVNTTKSLM